MNIYIYIYIYNIYIYNENRSNLIDPAIWSWYPWEISPKIVGIIRQDPAPLLALSEKFHLLCFGLRLDSAPRFRFPPWKLYVSYTMVIPCYTYHKPVLLGHHPRLTQPTNKKAGDPRLVLVNIANWKIIMYHVLPVLCSMYGIFTNICPKIHPSLGEYTIHRAYGL